MKTKAFRVFTGCFMVFAGLVSAAATGYHVYQGNALFACINAGFAVINILWGIALVQAALKEHEPS